MYPSTSLAVWAYALLLLASPSPADATSNSERRNVSSEECTHPPLNSCNFYAQYLESRYHCGQSGYPIGFGQKFCEKSLVWRPKMSVSGQEWITKTMLCLQEELVPFTNGPELQTCSELKQYALSTHAECYVRSGVCTLPIEDWGKILEIVGPALISELENFKSEFETAGDCVKLYIWLLGKIFHHSASSLDSNEFLQPPGGARVEDWEGWAGSRQPVDMTYI
ncbi:hypothetical protein KXV70_002163 [Aspergillus fumigatus]|nr:hypothetical protein KXX64_001743 [Aspergillus fumigatus]KAH1636026.1 hypothetical protein KXX39_007573 [Aspergillus fumigatus]KAH1939331.1 hypothetical protein KXV48_003540 [Aspergillus fumigatus]KAH1943231.1 hypothetical protein KXV59_000428 [Aspergillus fumigatus]KAH1977122.1 hypothetical protein KXX04_001096 [Aspergillus fumigatus]